MKLFATVLAGALFTPVSAVVVYDHVTNNPLEGAFFFNERTEWGDDLHLTGTEPINRLSFTIGVPQTYSNSMTARVYDRIGSSGLGALLGSATSNFTLPVGNHTISFDLPSVQPLSSNVWVTLEIFHTSYGTGTPQPYSGGSPVIGTSQDLMGYRLASSGTWNVLVPHPNFNWTLNMAVKVEAVPEPATCAVLAGALIFFARRRKRVS